MNDIPPKRVMAFIDGFNLYHALDKYDRGKNELEKSRYRKYKWLCLTSLMKRFLQPNTETLIGVEWFTTYPNWDAQKRFHHSVYASVQTRMGVHITWGEFKERKVICRATCLQEYTTNEEKQTDVNIAIGMLDYAPQYDKLILVTADSDQVPALKLIQRLHPEKIRASLPPIGRKSKEIARVCHESFRMTEQHLIDCQLPNPFPLIKDGQQYATIVKPLSWA
jgi:uncharacterized LabA/DUF88 family protein